MLYDSEAVGEALQSRAAISRGLTLKNEDRKTSTLPADSGGDAAGRWNRRGPFLLIVAITLLTFSRAFTADFVMWDDDMLIYRNRTLLPPTLHSLRVWWTSADMRMWNPLTETWRGLLALATTSTVDPITRTQLNPYIFHANNVLLHVLTTLMVYRVLLLLRLDRWPACCGALLFGLHPVQVEPVAWATALKDILCGFLSVAAIWALLRADGFSVDDQPKGSVAEPWKSNAQFVLASVLFVLATLSKPTGVILPLIALPLIWLRRSPIPRKIWLQMGVWIVLGMPMMIVTKLLQSGATERHHVDFWQRPFIAADTLAFYLYKLVWPATLAIDYGRRPALIFQNAWAYWTWILPASLAVALVLFRARARVLCVAAVVFTVPLLPVLGLLQFDFQTYSSVADRYLYLSMLGAAICFAWVVQRANRAGAIAASMLLAVLAGISWHQTGYWQDSMALLFHAVAVNPVSPVALNNLAFCYDNMGDVHTEIALLHRAIAARPEWSEAYMSLGDAEVKLGHWDRAAEAYRAGHAVDPAKVSDEAVRIASNYGSAHQNDLAIWYGRLAVQFRPESWIAHLNLGTALAETGDRAAAIRELREAARLKPSEVTTQCSLAAVLALSGHLDEAEFHYRQALAIQPDAPAAIAGLKRITALRDLPERPR